MVNRKKTIAACAGALGIAAGVVLVLPATASAAPYNGKCGAGYNQIDAHPLNGGTVYLTYNKDNGNNCVVTILDSPRSQNHKVWMDAHLTPDGSATVAQADNFTTYAGPVYAHAPHTKITWGGRIGATDNSWTSDHVHGG